MKKKLEKARKAPKGKITKKSAKKAGSGAVSRERAERFVSSDAPGVTVEFPKTK